MSQRADERLMHELRQRSRVTSQGDPSTRQVDVVEGQLADGCGGSATSPTGSATLTLTRFLR